MTVTIKGTCPVCSKPHNGMRETAIGKQFAHVDKTIGRFALVDYCTLWPHMESEPSEGVRGDLGETLSLADKIDRIF